MKIAFFFLLLINGIIMPQTEKWVPVFSDEEKSSFINSIGLAAYAEGDIFVWSLDELKKPLVMEEIDEKIFYVKSYYMLSREYQRYSLVEIIYYDKSKNVLKSYRYEHNYDKPEFKYNSPILKNSEIEKILAKSEEIIASAKTQ
jgi:hypothetical protein